MFLFSNEKSASILIWSTVVAGRSANAMFIMSVNYWQRRSTNKRESNSFPNCRRISAAFSQTLHKHLMKVRCATELGTSPAAVIDIQAIVFAIKTSPWVVYIPVLVVVEWWNYSSWFADRRNKSPGEIWNLSRTYKWKCIFNEMKTTQIICVFSATAFYTEAVTTIRAYLCLK